MRPRVVRAILLRELSSYFSTPTGYVFITLFVFLSAVAAFWQERFFASNQANLDTLNTYFPYLLIFLLPSISMSLWAEERRQGTEELLLTLPASDFQIVLGKYLAAVAIYSVSLLFSLSHVVVLMWLGSPDPGLMISTYLGYWLVGSSLLAVAMVGSALTDNLTVAFILGALLTGFFVFLDRAGTIIQGAPQRFLERLSVVEQFRSLASGVITVGAVAYFVLLAAAAFYANVALLGRRRWPSGPKAPKLSLHTAVRIASALVIAASATVLASQSRIRLDATSEQIHSLAPDTRKLLQSLDPRQPVFIHAYLSPEVPKSYLAARSNLVATLREFDALGGEAVHTRIIETLKYTPAAREAQERYNIRPYRVPVTEESAAVNEIFLGLVFQCGNEEFVIPFLDRGLPVEYELMRSVRVVSRAQRRTVGVLDTAARLFGGLDFQRGAQSQEWSIVGELRKQYQVRQIAPDADYPADLDALIVALPHTLTQPQLDRLVSYARQGKPLLVILDPMPAFNLELAPSTMEKAVNVRPLLDVLGLSWQPNRIVWDPYNPHPQLKSLPKEVIFVGKGFQQGEIITSGLQEVVLLYSGELRSRSDAKAKFVPLLETTNEGGTLRYEDLVQRSLFGTTLNPAPERRPSKEKHVLAARVTGPVNAIVLADVDAIGEQFFELRRRGVENLNFDNVTFILNAVDQLVGDTSFIALRKRRPRYRTLEAVEARTKQYEEQRLKQTQEAEALAEQRLREAQARLDRAVREIQQRTDIDDQAKQIMIANVQSVENRRLSVARSNIEDEKQRQVEASRAEMESSIRGIQNTIKLLAVVLPPIPALLAFLLVSARRLAREPATRL
ncbi:MAG: Gldg family protein [Bryobacteraceae bacterium]|nr:Gldg family protein [Bryobacteraceae bacterium]MDW8377157.1 Gldg family protein [Bryobacterales bacterium]